MLGYIIRRLVAAFLVVVVTSMFVFALFFLGPSNPASLLCNQNGRCTPERQALLEHQLGLDQSVVTQYAAFAKGLVVDRKIDIGATYECAAPCLGISFSTKSEVTQELVDRYPATLSVAIGGAALYLTLGVLAGSLAARWRGSAADRGLVTSTLLVSSIPYYIVALMSWLYLVNEYQIFKSEYFPITESPVKWAAGLLLPWLVLGFTGATTYARFSRGSMVDSLGEDYVRTAAAKGVSSNRVVFKHALRGAIVPVVTIFGLDFATLLAGTVFTEYIFGIEGIGRWGLQAITNQDFPIISATVLVGAVLVVLGNLVVDVLYSFLDPRVRLA